MKVSLIHAERRCSQPLAVDVVSEFRRLADAQPLPERLLPTQRYDLIVPRGVLFAFVVSAPLKQHGPAPLVIELEAEEGETLHDDSLRAFVIGPPPASYTEAALDEGKLERVAAPLARAGDRQQYGIASIEISPARDALLIAIANRARAGTCGPVTRPSLLAAAAAAALLSTTTEQPPPPAKRCGTCRSYRRNPQVIGQGACVWGPPQMVPVMAGGVPSLMSTRPTVGSEDVCDQWSEKDAD